MPYYPLLRTKKGEINALATLPATAAAYLRPILQVPPPDRDEDGALVAPSAEYITRVANTLQAVLAPSSFFTCYLDPSLAGLSTPLLSDLLFSISAAGGAFRPVYTLTGSGAYARLYRQFFDAPDQAVIRIRRQEITLSLADEVEAALKAYSLDARQVFILLDMGNISGPDFSAGFFELALKGTIIELISLGLTSIILASCALPESLEAIPKWEPKQYARREIELFRRMKKATRQHLLFGDYCTGAVIGEPSISRMGAPKVRYTLPECYEIVKGQMVGRTPNTMSEQYHRISQYIVQLPDYPGPTFSWGDNFIYEASKGGMQSRGNAATWVSVSTSHHLALVVSMLPAM